MNPRFLGEMVSYDVASNIRQECYRRVIDTHYEPSFIE